MVSQSLQFSWLSTSLGEVMFNCGARYLARLFQWASNGCWWRKRLHRCWSLVGIHNLL